MDEEREDFTEFRSRVSELIKNCVFIVGRSNVFNVFNAQLQATNQWEQLEAALFVMGAVGRNIAVEYTISLAVLHQILTLDHSIHIAVRLTTMS